MNVIDIIIVILLAWSAYNGFTKGLIISIASLLALLLGIFGSIKFSDITSIYLSEYFELNEQQLKIVSFAATFIIIVVAVHFVARIIDKIAKAVALGMINRIAGALFGIVRTAFVVSIVLFLVNNFDEKTGFVNDKLRDESMLYEPLSEFAPLVFPYLNFEKVEEYVPDAVQL